ncbi:MAG: Veg protein [Firmicutes bacterium]|jgi:uncharacterized protein Veg|nr:Veg protein [Bacillota bacterium]
MAQNNSLQRIKAQLDPLVGKRVSVRANWGRKRITEAEGILEKTYPKIFVVALNGKTNPVKRISYTYADIITQLVEVRADNKRIGELEA